MTAVETLSVISILSLSIAELSRIARGIDLITIANKDATLPIFSQLIEEIEERQQLVTFANLGRLNAVHPMSFLLISIGFVWVIHFSDTDSNLTVICGAYLLLLWFSFPLLQISEYDMIVTENININSLYHHWKSVVLMTIFLFYYQTVIQITFQLGFQNIQLVILAGLYMSIFTYNFIGFMSKVKDEINQAAYVSDG